jgi:hypothetical protein
MSSFTVASVASVASNPVVDLAHKIQSSQTNINNINNNTSSSSSSSKQAELAGIFYDCDVENRNALDRNQLSRALQLVGVGQAKNNDKLIKSMLLPAITPSSSSATNTSSSATAAATTTTTTTTTSRAKKRASFTSDSVKLETFLSATSNEIDKIHVSDFLLRFLKANDDDNNNSNNDNNNTNDDNITIDQLKHLLVSQSEHCLTDSELDEFLHAFDCSTGTISWKHLANNLAWVEN